MSLKLRIALAALALAAFVAPSRAAHFDLIYADRYDLVLGPGGLFTLQNADFGLFVNKGPSDVDLWELYYATFTVNTSVPDLRITPFVNRFNAITGPIPPNQAIGVSGVNGSELLPSLLLPGETFRNISPGQLIAFEMYRVGPYNGPVTTDMTMTVGEETVSFSLHFNFSTAPDTWQVQFLSVARTSSGTPTPARRLTWSRVKSLYR